MDILDFNDFVYKVLEPKVNDLIVRLVNGHHLTDSEKTYLQGQIRGRQESVQELINYVQEIVNATDK